MSSNKETKTTTCQAFKDLHPNIPLWLTIYFTKFTNDDLSAKEIDLINDLLTSKGRKDKLIFVFDSSLLDILVKKISDCQERSIVEKLHSIIFNLTTANKEKSCEGLTFSYQEEPQNGNEVIELTKDKFNSYLQNKAPDFTIFPLEVIDTNILDGVLSHDSSLLNKRRTDYLVNGYGKRCDKMFEEQDNLFKKTKRKTKKFHVDAPDNYVQSGGEEKLNFSHIHPEIGYSFFLIDNFFDIKKSQKNLWKHDGEGKKYRVSSEIKKVLKEHNFFIPNDIE